MRLNLDPLAMVWDWCGAENPFLCSISFGGGSKSSSSSGTKYKASKQFLEPFYNDFPLPKYSNEQDGVSVEDLEYEGQHAPFSPRQQFTVGLPKFTGLEGGDYDKLEKSIYERQKQNLDPDYNRGRDRIKEELSQSGLLTSPTSFAEGGALNVHERGYQDQLQKASSDAVAQRYGLQVAELARKQGFDFNVVKMIEEILAQRARVALQAGQKSKGSSSSSQGVGIGTGSSFSFG